MRIACGGGHANAHRIHIIQQSGPIRLIIGGPPCPNLCLANADRQGVLGEGANLLHYFYIILHHLKVLQPGVSVHFLMENVQGMGAHNKKYIRALFALHDPMAAHAIEFNSKVLGLSLIHISEPTRRP